jgi:ketosteroid isomerase-like protein
MRGVEFGRPWCVNRKRQFIQEGSRDADERAIEGILQQLETAWNRYDSMSFAMAFTEDANFIQIFGGQLDGRAAIQAAPAHLRDDLQR